MAKLEKRPFHEKTLLHEVLAGVALTLVLSVCIYLSGVRLVSQVILPTDVSSLWETPLAEAYQREGTLQGVTKVLSMIDPFSCDYAILQSRSLLATDRSLARQVSRKALAVGLAEPESWVAAGMAAVKDGGVQEGLALYERAVSLDPDRAGTRFHVGLALSDCLPSVRPANRELYRNLAELNLMMAATLAPFFSTDPRLCLALAELRAEEGDKKGAVAWARRISAKPSIDWILTARKMAVCFSVGENVEAVSTWRKARSCGISSREAEQIRKEIQKYRSIPDFAYILADLYGLRGDFHLARKELQKLVALRPNIAEYWLALGDTLRKLGCHDEAGDCYEKALVLSPANEDARRKVVEYYGG
jgi:tetratricopeptide (TPR) repeat protein